MEMGLFLSMIHAKGVASATKIRWIGFEPISSASQTDAPAEWATHLKNCAAGIEPAYLALQASAYAARPSAEKSGLLESNQPVVSLPKRATHLASESRIDAATERPRAICAMQRVRPHPDQRQVGDVGFEPTTPCFQGTCAKPGCANRR